MLGLTQGLSNTTTKLFSPIDVLDETSNVDFWWTSSYGTTSSTGTPVRHGEVIEHWHQRPHIGSTGNYLLVDMSTASKEFLKDRGYVYSEDGENSKFTLTRSDQETQVDLEASGDLYMLYRVRFGTFSGGSDVLCQDQDNSNVDHFRVSSHNSLRGKIAGGSARTWSFDTNTFLVDRWYTIELSRTSGNWTATVNGVSSSTSISDTGTLTMNRFFAVSDGHISDIIIKTESVPSAEDVIKLRTWMDRKSDLTWESGGLST